MKHLLKYLLLISFFISIGLNIRYIFFPPYPFKTQSDIINYSVKKQNISDEHFQKICNRIIKNFEADNDFIITFKLNNAEYEKYRLTQRDTIFPATRTNASAYGSMYPVLSCSYFEELNRYKIAEYKRAIELYCLHNSWAHPQNACCQETIDKIFEY